MTDSPTRITAFDGIGHKIKTVTLDGVDVTMVANWADPERGEVGIYPHSKTSDGSTYLTGDEPVTHTGRVEITFKE